MKTTLILITAVLLTACGDSADSNSGTEPMTCDVCDFVWAQAIRPCTGTILTLDDLVPPETDWPNQPPLMWGQILEGLRANQYTHLCYEAWDETIASPYTLECMTEPAHFEGCQL